MDSDDEQQQKRNFQFLIIYLNNLLILSGFIHYHQNEVRKTNRFKYI